MARLDGHMLETEFESRNSNFDTNRIYLAEVMDTRNITNAGELKVWVLKSGLDREDKEKWVTVSYCSSFFGTSPYKTSEVDNYYNAPKSFGSWFPMPCVGNYVFIFYACMHGELVQPFWFGCPVDSDINYMVPGIPSSYTSEKGPLCELNNKNFDKDYYGRLKPLTTKEYNQPIYVPLDEALKRQGLVGDKLRGPSTAGSKRESPSMCYGILTPLGNSMVIDDGWDEEDNRQSWDMDEGFRTNPESLVGGDGYSPFERIMTNRKDAGFRFRTRNGTQLLLSDNGNIYMINRNGTAWAEITDDGRLQGYAQTSADIACDGDINFKSKRKVIMEADDGFAFKSKNGGMTMELAGDLNISSPHIKTDSIATIPQVIAKIGNIESFESEYAQINGTFKGTLQGTALYATNAGIIPQEQPEPVISKAVIPELVLEPEKEIDGKGGEKQHTIVTFAPTAEPYDGHNRNEIYSELDVIKKPFKGKKNLGYTPIITNQVTVGNGVPDNSGISAHIPEMQLTEHYTLRDVCASSTADSYGINNTPDDATIEKLRLVCQEILEPITSNYGQKVSVNSGFRCIPLNSAVGGVSTSQHCKGEALDIEIAGISNYELACWVRDNLNYDQVILEYADNILFDKNSGWVHVSYKSSGNRNQALTINKSGTKSGIRK